MSNQVKTHICTQDELDGITAAHLGGPVVFMMAPDLSKVLIGEVLDDLPTDPDLASAKWGMKTAGIKRYCPEGSISFRGELAGNTITFSSAERV